MVDIEAAVDRPERMRQSMGNFLMLEIFHHVVDIFPELLQLPMVVGIDIIA